MIPGVLHYKGIPVVEWDEANLHRAGNAPCSLGCAVRYVSDVKNIKDSFNPDRLWKLCSAWAAALVSWAKSI